MLLNLEKMETVVWVYSSLDLIITALRFDGESTKSLYRLLPDAEYLPHLFEKLQTVV